MNQLLSWMGMGGYYAYVWSAYGVVAAVLVLNCLAIKRKKKHTQRQLIQWFKR